VLRTRAYQHVEQTQQRPDRKTWLELTPEDRAAIDRRIEQLRTGIEPEPNGQTFYDLKLMAAEDPKAFARESLLKYRPDMTATEMGELIDDQVKIRKGEKTPELDDFRSKKQIEDDALRAAGFDMGQKASKKDLERVKRFRDMVAQQVRAEQASTGKKIGNAQYEEIVDRLLQNVVQERPGLFGVDWLFGPDLDKPAFELTPEDFEIGDIPATEQTKIQEAIKRQRRRRGLRADDPIEPEEVIDWYIRKLQSQGGPRAGE
jgi:hypothetical protein